MFVLLVLLLAVLSGVSLGAMQTKFNTENLDRMHSGLFPAIADGVVVIEMQSRGQYTNDLIRVLPLVPGIQLSHDNPAGVLSVGQGTTEYTRDIGLKPTISEIKLPAMALL